MRHARRPAVDYTGHIRFDIDLLADRLVHATQFLSARPEMAGLPVGYFGASTGAGGGGDDER